MERKFSQRAASILLGTGAVRYGDPSSSMRGTRFMRRGSKVPVVCSGPVLGKLDRNKCPRCKSKMGTTRLAKKGPALPWCKKCRVVLPQE
jgi:hypothetical protein